LLNRFKKVKVIVGQVIGREGIKIYKGLNGDFVAVALWSTRVLRTAKRLQRI
jgi:hypothetical protein